MKKISTKRLEGETRDQQIKRINDFVRKGNLKLHKGVGKWVDLPRMSAVGNIPPGYDSEGNFRGFY